MKKDQIKSHFKEMKGNAKEVAGKVVEIREPGHLENIQNAYSSIAAAYAALQNEYKKAE